MSIDYGKTIHLPKTDFPRRAGLGKKEPILQARWKKMDLYKKQREAGKGKKPFILHLGPPFANGHIHIGHVLSTVLKDVVCRSYQMMGYDAPLVPGYDCHGLPIEWKIEEKFRKQKKSFDKDNNAAEFRTACREFAKGWVDIQSTEFARMGINAHFEKPYLTMDERSEASIAKEIHKFLLNGGLYRGSRPVMWSVAEQTALAEAEIEYKDITSDTAWVKFPVKSGLSVEGAHIVIWTTTPWTLPANRAIGYGAEIQYMGVEITKVKEDSLVQVGDKLIFAHELHGVVAKEAGILESRAIWTGKGSDLEGVVCAHPLHEQGYDFDVPLLPGDFVTTDAGTGFVHLAPGHGEDDYYLCLQHKVEVPQTVAGDGKYFDSVPVFAGAAVYYADGKKGPANKLVMAALEEVGSVVAKAQIQHSYPHSWRSKSPVIFRNTPQWFISMDKNGLREKALAEIKNVRWVPERGEKRITSMVEGRGDWCVSRQRAWGVPIAIFLNKETDEPLRDEKVLNNIISIFEKEGSDAWFIRPPSDFLGAEYNADDFEQVRNIIDVWFESGSTQGFVLEDRDELQRPADLYLEGSDQHRGWFQSSLLVGCGTRGNAPYKAVLTHGFILDEKGYKMSKSQGNVTDPMKLADAQGADILRLWVAGSDYTEDIKFGQNILKGHVDIYRRIRSTFCYLLGSLSGDRAHVEDKDLSDIDRFVLHRLFEVDAEVRQCIADFDFQKMVTTVHNFCARDLSAFYLDVCKDTLYCDAKDSIERRAIVTVLDRVFNHLVHWLSPFLVFTTEEAWLAYKGLDFEDETESIHLSQMPIVPTAWQNENVAKTFEQIMTVRRVVSAAIEPRRAAKEIGASLEAHPQVYVTDASIMQALKSVNFSDICITSGLEIIEGIAPEGAFVLDGVNDIGVVFHKSTGTKCQRCWKYTDDVGADSEHVDVCQRCAVAVRREFKSAA